jgi:hypothetical protein
MPTRRRTKRERRSRHTSQAPPGCHPPQSRPVRRDDRVLGCDSDEDRARLISVSVKTIYRTRRGVLGHDFITQTLINLQGRRDELAACNLSPTFDELFEIVEFKAE